MFNSTDPRIHQDLDEIEVMMYTKSIRETNRSMYGRRFLPYARRRLFS